MWEIPAAVKCTVLSLSRIPRALLRAFFVRSLDPGKGAMLLVM